MNITIKQENRSLLVAKDIEPNKVIISIGNTQTGHITGIEITKDEWDKIVETINKSFEDESTRRVT